VRSASSAASSRSTSARRLRTSTLPAPARLPLADVRRFTGSRALPPGVVEAGARARPPVPYAAGTALPAGRRPRCRLVVGECPTGRWRPGRRSTPRDFVSAPHDSLPEEVTCWEGAAVQNKTGRSGPHVGAARHRRAMFSPDPGPASRCSNVAPVELWPSLIPPSTATSCYLIAAVVPLASPQGSDSNSPRHEGSCTIPRTAPGRSPTTSVERLVIVEEPPEAGRPPEHPRVAPRAGLGPHRRARPGAGGSGAGPADANCLDGRKRLLASPPPRGRRRSSTSRRLCAPTGRRPVAIRRGAAEPVARSPGPRSASSRASRTWVVPGHPTDPRRRAMVVGLYQLYFESQAAGRRQRREGPRHAASSPYLTAGSPARGRLRQRQPGWRAGSWATSRGDPGSRARGALIVASGFGWGGRLDLATALQHRLHREFYPPWVQLGK
jgi:hypothetical protein